VNRIRVCGDTAVVTARVISTAHYGVRGSTPTSGRQTLFVRRDGRWRCALTHIAAATPA
jgi:ketosteroid isomerase-like protein